MRQHEIEEQPAAARVRRAADDTHLVQLAPRAGIGVRQCFRRDAHPVRGQRVGHAPPVGIDQDAARIQEHRFEGHAHIVERLAPVPTGR
jgi:hypothetical protein